MLKKIILFISLYVMCVIVLLGITLNINANYNEECELCVKNINENIIHTNKGIVKNLTHIKLKVNQCYLVNVQGKIYKTISDIYVVTWRDQI